jgi:hypothetical protein
MQSKLSMSEYYWRPSFLGAINIEDRGSRQMNWDKKLPFDANGQDSERKFIILQKSCPELTHNCLLLLYIVIMFKPMFRDLIFSLLQHTISQAPCSHVMLCRLYETNVQNDALVK